jgi:hypothetical protein
MLSSTLYIDEGKTAQIQGNPWIYYRALSPEWYRGAAAA